MRIPFQKTSLKHTRALVGRPVARARNDFAQYICARCSRALPGHPCASVLMHHSTGPDPPRQSYSEPCINKCVVANAVADGTFPGENSSRLFCSCAAIGRYVIRRPEARSRAGVATHYFREFWTICNSGDFTPNNAAHCAAIYRL